MTEVTWLGGTECPSPQCNSETFVVDLSEAERYLELKTEVKCSECGYDLEFGVDWA